MHFNSFYVIVNYLGDHGQSKKEPDYAHKANEHLFTIATPQMIGEQIHNCCHEAFNAHKLERIKILPCLNINVTHGDKRFTYYNQDFFN